VTRRLKDVSTSRQSYRKGHIRNLDVKPKLTNIEVTMIASERKLAKTRGRVFNDPESNSGSTALFFRTSIPLCISSEFPGLPVKVPPSYRLVIFFKNRKAWAHERNLGVLLLIFGLARLLIERHFSHVDSRLLKLSIASRLRKDLQRTRLRVGLSHNESSRLQLHSSRRSSSTQDPPFAI
jgi:hypothetical protein